MKLENRSAVLMARLEHGDGTTLRRAEVAAVRCSFQAFGRALMRDGEHQLRVADMLFDGLRKDGPWTADDVGYNFRHELEADVMREASSGVSEFELCYEFTPTRGDKFVVRFRIGCQGDS